MYIQSTPCNFPNYWFILSSQSKSLSSYLAKRVIKNWRELRIVGSCLFQMKMMLLVNHREFQSKFVHRCLEPHKNQHISSYQQHSFHPVCLPVGETKVGRAACLLVFKACCQMSSSAPLWNCITQSVNNNWWHLLLDKQKVRDACVFERSWNNSVLNERSMITGAELKASWIVTDVSSWETERACGSFYLVCGCWTGA